MVLPSLNAGNLEPCELSALCLIRGILAKTLVVLQLIPLTMRRMCSLSLGEGHARVSCFRMSNRLHSGNYLGLSESASYAYEVSVLSMGL